jgi:hypothetical protein
VRNRGLSTGLIIVLRCNTTQLPNGPACTSSYSGTTEPVKDCRGYYVTPRTVEPTAPVQACRGYSVTPRTVEPT